MRDRHRTGAVRFIADGGRTVRQADQTLTGVKYTGGLVALTSMRLVATRATRHVHTGAQRRVRPLGRDTCR